MPKPMDDIRAISPVDCARCFKYRVECKALGTDIRPEIVKPLSSSPTELFTRKTAPNKRLLQDSVELLMYSGLQFDQPLPAFPT